MNFKLWFVLSETLDALTKGALEQDKSPKDELAAFIKELEDEPDLIDRKAAFARLRERFPPTKQKPIKQEDGRIKLYKDKLDANQITKPEFDTFMLFIGESNKDLVTQAMNLLRRFIENNIINLEVKNNKIYITKDDETKEFNDFTRFESELHSIRDNLTEYKQKSGVFNPIIGEQKHRNNLAAKGDKVWVFRGDTPELCRIFGKNQIWCISSSDSAAHWFSYRIRFSQTQYFVFDFNKEENDPARYVNPGVAPEGEHSEWVDARNNHTTDPEDNNSQVGINGYKSINQYKKYLASKGIPENIWTTTEPEEWEERLQRYDNRKNFEGAKRDSDPRILPMYLKIVNNIKDDDFDTLTDDQKKEFIFGKLEMLTANQFEFAKNISGYFNSLNLISKIIFLSKTKKSDLLEDLIKKSELNDLSIADILLYAGDTLDYKQNNEEDRGLDDQKLNNYMLTSHAYEIIKIISNTKKSFSNDLIRILLDPIPHRRAVDKIIEVIISKMPDSFDVEINTLMYYAYNKVKIAEIIINKLGELSESNFKGILGIPTNSKFASAKENTFHVAKLLVAKKTELNSSNIEYLMRRVSWNNWGTDEMARLIINKKPYLSGDDVFHLIEYANIKKKIVELLGLYNINKMSFLHILNLLRLDHNDELKTIFKRYYTGTNPEIISLLSE
jgi:hypothetical protein